MLRKIAATIKLTLFSSLFFTTLLKSQSIDSLNNLLTRSSSIKMDYSRIPSSAFQAGRDKWNNGAYMHVDLLSSIFYTFDSSGKLVSNLQLSISGADKIDVYDSDIGHDQSVWVSGNTFASDGRRAQFLAHLLPDNRQVLIRTAPYAAYSLAVAPDGTVWTLGSEEIGNARDLTTHANTAANVLRHFDESGKLISSFIPYSTVSRVQVMTGRLAVNDGVVGWYSPEFGPAEYIELSTDNNSITRLPGVDVQPNVKRIVSGFALTSARMAFVTLDEPSTSSNLNNEVSLYTLDRGTKSWRPIDLPRPRGTRVPELSGSQGLSLIFTADDKSTVLSFSTK